MESALVLDMPIQLTGTFIGGAILPSVLKQDPRYFYKGTGSTTSRALYALANSIICKGDNRQMAAELLQRAGKLGGGGNLKSLLSGARSRRCGTDA